jgi:hypothetical protein
LNVPSDLDAGYFRPLTAAGAFVSSNSWGSDGTAYDQNSAQVDAFAWAHPASLPVFPAGNSGDVGTGEGSVESPSNAKNCLAVGGTLSSDEEVPGGARLPFEVWTAQMTSTESAGGAPPPASFPVGLASFPVVGAMFGDSLGSLGGQAYPLAAASPPDACASLGNGSSSSGLGGAVALVARGGCTFAQKALAAQAAGAAAVLLYDDVGANGYYPPDDYAPSKGSGAIAVPTAMVPRSLGEGLAAQLAAGRRLALAFSRAAPPAVPPPQGFDNLAGYSGRGPVGPDARLKPDLVAPGTITSAAANTPCGAQIEYGTSMATPVVAGAAALVRQYYQDGYCPSGAPVAADARQPSAALLKATLVVGAAPMHGLEASTGLPLDPPPSMRQGYGRVRLAGSLALAGTPASVGAPRRMAVADSVPAVAGEVHVYCLGAGTGGAVGVTLAWTDPPASPAAARSLVNDLDLVVVVVRVAAGGAAASTRVLGNGGSRNDSALPDSVNNVESVRLPPGPAARLEVQVRAAAVQAQFGPQPYALIVVGDFEGDLVRSATGSCEEAPQPAASPAAAAAAAPGPNSPAAAAAAAPAPAAWWAAAAGLAALLILP